MFMKHPSKKLHNHPVATGDLAHLLLGEGIGYGQNRSVWALTFNPELVIKLEGGSDFQNIMEWNIWKGVKGTKLEKWFAPCVAISPNGIWLVQKRITFPPRSAYPPKLPAFLGDLKYANYGKFGKQWVACDYGTPAIAWLMSKHLKETKADWWSKKPGDKDDG